MSAAGGRFGNAGPTWCASATLLDRDLFAAGQAQVDLAIHLAWSGIPRLFGDQLAFALVALDVNYEEIGARAALLGLLGGFDEVHVGGGDRAHVLLDRGMVLGLLLGHVGGHAHCLCGSKPAD